MPPQNLEKERQFSLKELNMARGITSNNSNEELVSSSGENSTEKPVEPTIRDVKISEWIAMLILCFVNLINYMDRFTLAGILDDIQKHYNIKNDQAGLLQTSFILSYMIFAPLFGYLGDRYNRKIIMASGVALWSVTTLVGSFMNNFVWFIVFRALVGIGEASYSTIAPTIISDLFIKSVRSKMLAFFYFAIPVGSGLGYIVGSETAKALGSWQWALRVTPGLGLIAVILLLVVLKDPERGASEGSGHMTATSWKEDLKDISKNPSFILSTGGFTCVAFVAGALSWWGPKFIFMGIRLQRDDAQLNDVSYKFGLISMASGLLGVPAGSFLAQRLRHKYPRIDAYICAGGLLMSAPIIFLALITAATSDALCFAFVFFGEFFLNLTWSIVADILLYVVLPTRRSTAEGVQLLVSHALGDAGSPYIIGVISDWLATVLSKSDSTVSSQLHNSSEPLTAALSASVTDGTDDYVAFKALQYALFTTCFVEVLGGLFFLVNALFIVKDRQKVERAVRKGDADIGFDRQSLPRYSDASFT